MRPLVTPTIDALVAYDHGKPVDELEQELGVELAKLAANENPLGPSPRAVDAAQRALVNPHRYPDAGARLLRERLAAFHGVGVDEIVQGNGSNELIELVVRTFATSSDHIVFAEPAFVVYRLISLSHGVPFTAVPLKRWTHDLDAMQAAVTPATKIFFITNPNNPSGTYVTKDAVIRLLKELSPEIVVVFDEAYADYADAEDFPDSIALRDVRERLISIRTFSKIYGLASLRVGYAIGPKAMVDYMHRVRPPFNVNGVAQAAAVAALEDQEHVQRTRALNARERRRVSAALGELGLTVVPSQANFVFVDLERPAAAIAERLLGSGVLVRPFGPTSFLRITLGTEAENDRALVALAALLG